MGTGVGLTLILTKMESNFMNLKYLRLRMIFGSMFLVWVKKMALVWREKLTTLFGQLIFIVKPLVKYTEVNQWDFDVTYWTGSIQKLKVLSFSKVRKITVLFMSKIMDMLPLTTQGCQKVNYVFDWTFFLLFIFRKNFWWNIGFKQAMPGQKNLINRNIS